MTSHWLSRRDWGKFLLAAVPAKLTAAARTCVLQNAAIALSVAVDGGKVVSRRLSNRLTSETLDLPPEEFALEFEDGAKVKAADLKAEVVKADAARIEFLFTGRGIEVLVRHECPSGKAYLRKRINLRQTGGEPRRLMRAELENWRGVRRDWKSMTADHLKYGSHPIFCDSWWSGIEFPVAFNEYDAGGFVLCSRPGGRQIGSTWLALRSTVTGVATPGGVRDAFLAYLEDVRLAPPRLVACYNSWWTLPKVVKQRDNLALIRELRDAMHTPHGVFFDIVTTDMGWSNPRSVWEIDRSILPAGFDDIRAIVEPAGGRLGLWMSPSEQYPPVCDYEWFATNGYTVLRPDSGCGKYGVSLADPRYRSETKAALRKLIRENGLAHIKYDGFCVIEASPHHGLLPGPDSIEALAEYSLELLQASKAENPELVTEPTYMNSFYSYISPWIPMHSDTIWANGGGDCPLGIGPAPDYRESNTNAREYHIFTSLDEVWAPQNAVHYFDIVHVDSPDGFPNHAAMAFGRGRFFISTYLNPKLMSQEDWRIYAGLLRWARNNREILRNTVVVPSRVELGEPYVYGHWLGSRGILAVRNPSNESKAFTIDLRKAGAPKRLVDAVCYTQYPYRKGIASGLRAASPLRVDLAPWELLFLEIVPRTELKETVVLDARWYRGRAGAAFLVPEPGVDRVRVLAPGGGESTLRVTPRTRGLPEGRVTSQEVRRLPESNWLSAAPRRPAAFSFRYPAVYGSPEIDEVRRKGRVEKPTPSVAFDVECSVTVPRGTEGKVLLLVEAAGRQFLPSLCRAQLDGVPVPLEGSDSDERVGFYMARKDNYWKDMLAYETNWSWYFCRALPGEHKIRFSGKAGNPNPRLTVWAWAEQDLAALAIPLKAACSEPAMPQYRAHTEREGVRFSGPA
ncbi:MAG: hypothetical protein LC130_12175 [Bryobacterales bacterium]|nr:hypothetical protein [Bryobacterales bacterium]